MRRNNLLAQQTYTTAIFLVRTGCKIMIPTKFTLHTKEFLSAVMSPLWIK